MRKEFETKTFQNKMFSRFNKFISCINLKHVYNIIKKSVFGIAFIRISENESANSPPTLAHCRVNFKI